MEKEEEEETEKGEQRNNEIVIKKIDSTHSSLKTYLNYYKSKCLCDSRCDSSLFGASLFLLLRLMFTKSIIKWIFKFNLSLYVWKGAGLLGQQSVKKI